MAFSVAVHGLSCCSTLGTRLPRLVSAFHSTQCRLQKSHRLVRTNRFSSSFIIDRDDYRKALPAEWAHLPLKLRWLRPTLFFFSTSIAIFATAAYATNVETDDDLRSLDSEIELSATSNRNLRRAKHRTAVERWSIALEETRSWVGDTPFGENGRMVWTSIWTAVQNPMLFCCAHARPEAVAIAILMPLAIAWYIPPLHGFLFRHSTHSFRSGKSYTMLTSLFSHQPFQLANIFAAWATVPIAADWFMRESDLYESSPWYHLTAFLISAGMFSFLAPQFITYVRFRRAFKELARGIPGPYTNSKLNKALSYSLGISGGIHACLTLAVCSRPDVPALGSDSKITRGMLWAGVCTLEAIGMLLSVGNIGWMANLCGAVFGVIYNSQGLALWGSMRILLHKVQFPEAWQSGRDSDDLHPLIRGCSMKLSSMGDIDRVS